jgi:hypothetical protein
VVRLLVSVEERDRPALGNRPRSWWPLCDAAEALSAAGLRVVEHRPAAAPDVARLGSSWARRLDIPQRRAAWLLTAVKPA